MLFRKRFWAGIEDGSVTLAFRRWKRSNVVAGRSRRTPVGIVDVISVREVDAGGISDAEAARAGYETAEELRRRLGEDDGRPVFRIMWNLLSAQVDQRQERDVGCHRSFSADSHPDFSEPRCKQPG